MKKTVLIIAMAGILNGCNSSSSGNSVSPSPAPVQPNEPIDCTVDCDVFLDPIDVIVQPLDPGFVVDPIDVIVEPIDPGFEIDPIDPGFGVNPIDPGFEIDPIEAEPLIPCVDYECANGNTYINGPMTGAPTGIGTEIAFDIVVYSDDYDGLRVYWNQPDGNLVNFKDVNKKKYTYRMYKEYDMNKHNKVIAEVYYKGNLIGTRTCEWAAGAPTFDCYNDKLLVTQTLVTIEGVQECKWYDSEGYVAAEFTSQDECEVNKEVFDPIYSF